MKFERDRQNISTELRGLSGSKGGRGGDAKTILSPNTSFGDIITTSLWPNKWDCLL